LSVAVAADVMKKHRSIDIISRLLYAGFDMSRSEPYMPSLEYVAKQIDAGWNVAIFPEGKISKYGKLQEFKSGIGLLAIELDVPVVPVKTIGLFGTAPLHSKWPKKHSRVIVKIGKPMTFDKQTNYDDATAKMRQVIEDM
jgi:long-chain acyl-CoA synthetase